MLTCISYWQAGSGSQPNPQNLDAGTLPPDINAFGQDHVKVPTIVIIPIVIVTIALLIPLWLCLRKLHGSERVTPLYRQEHDAEKPKLCEVALMGTSLGGKIVPDPWRRLRVSPPSSSAAINHLSARPFRLQPLSIDEHSSYWDLKDSSSSCYDGRSLSPSSKRSSSGHSLGGRRDSLDGMSHLRVGVLIAMPSPPQSGRKTPDDAVPMPDLYLGFSDASYSPERH